MMDELVFGILSMVLVFALIPLYLWKKRKDSASRDLHRDEQQLPQPDVALRAASSGGGRRMRRRHTASSASSSRVTEPTIEDAGNDSDDEGMEEDDYADRAATKKEKKRQEREAQRQAEEASRESRKAKQDKYAEMRRKRDEEYEARERAEEEEAKARKAKEEEAVALEFEKWKGEFSIDEEGTVENESADGTQDLLASFVDYIKKHKCVPLEDLAAEFKLRTQDCINRINSLESSGRISGVMDDRGKFIYISVEEMKAVADYIKREGRVSISHLASKSNQFIDLETKMQAIEVSNEVEPVAG